MTLLDDHSRPRVSHTHSDLPHQPCLLAALGLAGLAVQITDTIIPPSVREVETVLNRLVISAGRRWAPCARLDLHAHLLLLGLEHEHER